MCDKEAAAWEICEFQISQYHDPYTFFLIEKPHLPHLRQKKIVTEELRLKIVSSQHLCESENTPFILFGTWYSLITQKSHFRTKRKLQYTTLFSSGKKVVYLCDCDNAPKVVKNKNTWEWKFLKCTHRCGK